MYNSSLIDRSCGKTKTKGAQLIYYIGTTIRPITLQKQPILQILAYFKGMDQARYSWPFRSHTCYFYLITATYHSHYAGISNSQMHRAHGTSKI